MNIWSLTRKKQSNLLLASIKKTSPLTSRSIHAKIYTQIHHLGAYAGKGTAISYWLESCIFTIK